MKKLITSLLLVLLAACASTDPVKERNLTMVVPGMGKEDVQSLLGQPNTVKKVDATTEQWIWTKGLFAEKGSPTTITFTNGIVATVSPGKPVSLE